MDPSYSVNHWRKERCTVLYFDGNPLTDNSTHLNSSELCLNEGEQNQKFTCMTQLAKSILVDSVCGKKKEKKSLFCVVQHDRSPSFHLFGI